MGPAAAALSAVGRTPSTGRAGSWTEPWESRTAFRSPVVTLVLPRRGSEAACRDRDAVGVEVAFDTVYSKRGLVPAPWPVFQVAVRVVVPTVSPMVGAPDTVTDSEKVTSSPTMSPMA